MDNECVEHDAESDTEYLVQMQLGQQYGQIVGGPPGSMPQQVFSRAPQRRFTEKHLIESL